MAFCPGLAAAALGLSERANGLRRLRARWRLHSTLDITQEPAAAAPQGQLLPALVQQRPEIVLQVLEMLTSADLARLDACCSDMLSPLGLAGSEQQRMSEVAALNMVARRRPTDSSWRVTDLKPRTPGRGAPSPFSWCRLLFLAEVGFLKPGVQHDLPAAALERAGWQLAYQEPYDHRTRDSDLEKVPPEARFVLAAAKHGVNCATFALAAWGRRSTVLKVTHDDDFGGCATHTSNLEDGVYWYRWPDHSFGFSSHQDLWLWNADCLILMSPGEVNPSDRLSWNLDLHSTGGWRAGHIVELGQHPGHWLKCLYYLM